MAELSDDKKGYIDRPFVFLIVLGVVASVACYLIMGEDVVRDVFYKEGWRLVDVIPRIAAATLLGGFLQALASKDLVGKWVGRESGWKGLLIGTVAGAVMPGGPITTFPLVVAFYSAGADMGALIAFLVSWSILGFNRVIVWELPFLGQDFVFVRLLASAWLPIVAGLIARRLPPLELPADARRG